MEATPRRLTMTTPTLTHKTEWKEADVQVSYLDEMAETIRDEALAQAREKLRVRYRDLNPARLLHRPDFLDYFKYALACGVAEALAANDRLVQAVYTYDPALNSDSEWSEERPLDTLAHLLVVVKKPSAALEAFVAALDRALTAVLKALPSATFAQCESVLDVSVITEQEVRLGLGYAAMLASVFAPPLRVWQREA
jgi:hypothetical protein